MKKNDFYPESCDMYEFMSDYVGLKILHPGGVEATNKLLELLKIDKDRIILDIACGKGYTSVYLARKYGCQVIGIDICEKSIEEANDLAKKKGISHLVSFQVVDACKLPFLNEEFDITLAQAMLVLVKDTDKIKVIEEATRVLKKSGRSGWSELSWIKQPTQDFLEAAAKETCAKGIANAMTFDGWESLFKNGGLKEINTIKAPLHFRGISGIIKDEGVVNGIKIMFKFMTDSRIRARMQRLNNFFRTYQEYLGYGIYIGKK
jgi:ubiquinone/menaquinone biosynthesis C-methylase UbiE